MSDALRVVKDDDEQPWYRDGLRFQCTGCGKCCTGGPGYTWLNENEIVEIAAYLKISVEEFAQRYLRKVGQRFSLKEDPKNYDCVFLEGKGCQIYPVRPTQCRTYPWWPAVTSSSHAWEREAEYCEGIRNDAPVVPPETIEANLKIHGEESPMR